MCRARRQKSQRGLVSFVPAFAGQSAGADGNQRLIDLVGFLAFGIQRANPFGGRGVWASKTRAEIDQQAVPLIFLEFDGPPTGWRKEDINQKNRGQGSYAAYEPA